MSRVEPIHLEPVRHGPVVGAVTVVRAAVGAVPGHHEWCGARVEAVVLEAAHSDGVLSGEGVTRDLDVVVPACRGETRDKGMGGLVVYMWLKPAGRD